MVPGNLPKDSGSEPTKRLSSFSKESGRFHWCEYGACAGIFQKIEKTFVRGQIAIGKVLMKKAGLLATRRSLVDRLANWDDRQRWQEFFDTYWKLIYSAAGKSGLTDAEAQEVVQETIITVAKKIDKLRYDPSVGSFKGWLLQITRWRIADQFRKREPGQAKRVRSPDDRLTATIERIPDSNAVDLDAALGKRMAGKLVRRRDHANQKESRSEAIPDFRLLRAQRLAGPESCRAVKRKYRAGLSGASPRFRAVEKGNQSAGENGGSRSVVTFGLDATERVPPGIASRAALV